MVYGLDLGNFPFLEGLLGENKANCSTDKKENRGGLGSSPDGIATICATHEEVPLPLSYEDIGSLHDCELSSIRRASWGWRLKGKDKIGHKAADLREADTGETEDLVRKMAMC